jgi:hypothetical protein
MPTKNKKTNGIKHDQNSSPAFTEHADCSTLVAAALDYVRRNGWNA